MVTKLNKLSILHAGVSTVISGLILIYLIILTLTMGASIISGFFVGLMFLKVGLAGLAILILLVLFNINLSKLKLLIIMMITNVLSEILQSIIRSSEKLGDIGGTVIERHHEVERTLIGIGDVIWIFIVSSALFCLFFWFLKKNTQFI